MVADDKQGVRVSKVEEGSPANKTNIKVGDIISYVNEKRITDSIQFQKLMVQETEHSMTITLTVNGKKKKLTIEKYAENLIASRCGFRVMALTPWIAKRLHISRVEKGVLISDVYEKSAADVLGLKVGDIVIKMGSARITSINDIIAILKKHQSSQPLEVVIVRGEQILKGELDLNYSENQSQGKGI